MRISTQMMFQNSLSAMQRQQTAMARAQEEIASGRKLLSPEDDPVAVSTVNQMEKRNSKLTQYQRNIDFATGKLQNQEGLLSNMQDRLQRVREISIASNNDLGNANTRKTFADELKGLRDDLKRLVNSTDENGDFVFSGIYAKESPFVPNGAPPPDTIPNPAITTTTPVNVEIGEGEQVSVSNYGTAFLASGGSDVFAALDTMIADLEAGNPVAVAQETIIAGVQDQVSLTQSTIGNRINRLDQAFENNDTEGLANTKVLSRLRDTDYAEAITKLNQEYMALQATQQSFAKIQGLSLFNYIS